jgi:hypothetical protein
MASNALRGNHKLLVRGSGNNLGVGPTQFPSVVTKEDKTSM